MVCAISLRDRMNMSVSADSERFGSGCESVCRLSRNARGPVALRLGLCQPAEFSSPAVQPLVCALDIGCGTATTAVHLARLGVRRRNSKPVMKAYQATDSP